MKSTSPDRIVLVLRRPLFWLLLAPLVWAFGIEPRWVEVTFHDATAGAAAPLRVVQLTDLHIQRLGMAERRVLAATLAARPQVVVLTGDMLDRADRLPVLAEFLAGLPGTAVRLAVPGNWEYWSHVDLGTYRAMLATRGVRWLVNESAVVTQGGRSWLFAGLDDATAGQPDLARAMRGIDLAAHDRIVVLAHTPETGLGAVAPARPLLQLSGHTHGGQLRVLGWSPFLPPGTGDYVAGWYREPGLDRYVSRGLGMAALPARLGARPEVAVFDL